MGGIHLHFCNGIRAWGESKADFVLEVFVNVCAGNPSTILECMRVYEESIADVVIEEFTNVCVGGIHSQHSQF